jgi:hypothetical protein
LQALTETGNGQEQGGTRGEVAQHCLQELDLLLLEKKAAHLQDALARPQRLRRQGACGTFVLFPLLAFLYSATRASVSAINIVNNNNNNNNNNNTNINTNTNTNTNSNGRRRRKRASGVEGLFPFSLEKNIQEAMQDLQELSSRGLPRLSKILDPGGLLICLSAWVS